MKRILFYAFTPFEAISSLAVFRAHFPGDSADILLADSIQGRDEMRANIEQARLFRSVFYADIRTFFPKGENRLRHEWNRLKSSFSPCYLAESAGFSESYDIFITTEIDYYTESVYSLLRKRNPAVEVRLMDEGYSSYTYYFREAYSPVLLKNRIKSACFRIPGAPRGRKFIANEAKVIYFFAPELLCWKDMPYQIEPIRVRETPDFIPAMNQLFGFETLINEGILQEYDRPFIFFEECQFWDRGNNRDVELINHIGEIVGKDNLLIKLHPRNRINRFEKSGYHTNKRYGIPWELIASNLPENQNRVFLAFSSGAVLNYKFLSNKNFKTILLYRCVGENYYKLDDSVLEWFERFRDAYGNSVLIPESMKELDEILRALQ